jgi:DNA-directed RNA polymerase subunit RPC12/RpoP
MKKFDGTQMGLKEILVANEVKSQKISCPVCESILTVVAEKNNSLLQFDGPGVICQNCSYSLVLEPKEKTARERVWDKFLADPDNDFKK